MVEYPPAYLNRNDADEPRSPPYRHESYGDKVGSLLAGDFSSAIASKLASYNCIVPAKASGSRNHTKVVVRRAPGVP
jgi:hypothetical protein